MKKPMLPIGVSDFGKLIRHVNTEGNKYLFIDKSIFIKDILDAGDEISLITRPRRFGKTLNMSMLQYFFASEINGISTKGLFDNLKISNFPQVMAYQGQYPVIFLTLKEIKGKNFNDAFEILQETFRELFKSYSYIFDSPKISHDDKLFIDSFISKRASISEYKSSLLFLSNLLYKVYQKQVIILIDEYDTPLHYAFADDYYEDMRSLISGIFSKALKGNSFLFKSVITGVLKIAKSSLFSDLNNVEDYTTIYSKLYAQYFGFTESELDYLLKQTNLPSNIPLLKQTYNGYLINDTILYNPFSIICFIKNALLSKKSELEEAIKFYWINSGGTALLKKITAHNLGDIQPMLSDLINKKTIKTLINENIIIGNVLLNDTVAYWSLLLISGYLKVVGKEKDRMGRIKYQLKFPNEEVRKSMENLFLELASGNNSYNYIVAIESLALGETKQFKNILHDFMRRTPSFYDTEGRFKEQFIHGLILGMTACLSHSHIIKSNRESGDGRYDIALEPKDKTQKGIIIELKSLAEHEDLEENAKLALSQIENLNYENDMKHRGIKYFIHLGIAFRKKEIAIKEKYV